VSPDVAGRSVRFQAVLVVEDDAVVRQALEWTLEAEGIPVAAAATGRRALELAGSQRPGLLLLDLGLPDITGEAVAEGVRATHGDVPILVMTADGRAAEKAERVGAIGYLSKPFELDELIAVVKRTLGAP
jgi:two-component system response regulator AtoC